MVSQFYPPVAGGQEQHVRNLAHALVDRGHHVEVVTIAADGSVGVALDGVVVLHRIRTTSQRLPQLYSDSSRPHAMPVMDPDTGETLVDELGRRSYTTSLAYGPTIGKNIGLAYLPWAYCQEGRRLNVEYFGETYRVEVAAVGYKPLYDPENLKPRS